MAANLGRMNRLLAELWLRAAVDGRVSWTQAQSMVRTGRWGNSLVASARHGHQVPPSAAHKHSGHGPSGQDTHGRVAAGAHKHIGSGPRGRGTHVHVGDKLDAAGHLHIRSCCFVWACPVYF